MLSQPAKSGAAPSAEPGARAAAPIPAPPAPAPLVEIRPIRPDEFAAEADLAHRAYAAGPYAAELAPDEAWQRTERDTAGRDAAGRVLVAVAARDGAIGQFRAGDLVGAATLLRGAGPFTKISEAGEAELRLVCVDPEAQGCGIGEALVRRGLERALEWGATALRLDTGVKNPAQRLYERLGFHPTPERDARVGGGYGDSLSYAYKLQDGADVRVRLIRDDEIGEVSRLVLDAYAGDYAGLNADYLVEIGDVAGRAGEHRAWVAEHARSGELLATVTTPRPGAALTEELVRGGEMDFRLLGVSRSARGRGLGALLVHHCLRLARIRGYRRAVLNTSTQMEGPMRLYERLGFERMRERERDFLAGDGSVATLVAYGLDL